MTANEFGYEFHPSPAGDMVVTNDGARHTGTMQEDLIPTREAARAAGTFSRFRC